MCYSVANFFNINPPQTHKTSPHFTNDGVVVSEIMHQDIFLKDILPHEKNYRIHSERQIAALCESLERFGQVRSVVVSETQDGSYKMIAGHGIYEAAKRVGIPQLHADVFPASVSEKDLRAYLIADNKLGDLAGQDEYLLLELLEEQQLAGYNEVAMGLYDGELEDLVAKLRLPTLESLTDKYGDDPKEEDYWPVVRVKVSPELKERYDAVVATVKDDPKKFAHMVGLAEKQQAGMQVMVPEGEEVGEISLAMLRIPVTQELLKRVYTLFERIAGSSDQERFALLIKKVEMAGLF
jgi:ParB-like chromosome segregation protein Spo0J